jgi:hypothetical protein
MFYFWFNNFWFDLFFHFGFNNFLFLFLFFLLLITRSL